MYVSVAHLGSAKKMWNHIVVLCEGIVEVKENKRQILVSLYEAFMA